MSEVFIPLDKHYENYFTVKLGNKRYKFRLRWNELSARWFMDITLLDEVEIPIINSKLVVHGIDYFANVTNPDLVDGYLTLWLPLRMQKLFRFAPPDLENLDQYYLVWGQK